MSKELTAQGFDYASLDEDTAGKLRYYAGEVRKQICKNIESIAMTGRLLSEARVELASHNKNEGVFVRWATTEFDLGKQTVYNYLNAWDRILSNGWTRYQHLTPTAVYLLASDNVPNAVRKKIEHLAAQNETVRKADIERLIQGNGKPKATTPASSAEGEIQQETRSQTAATADAGGEIETRSASTDVGRQESSLVDRTQGEDGGCSPSSPEREGSIPSDSDDTPEPDQWRIERSRAKKTAEALMRSLGDLNDMKPIAWYGQAIDGVRGIIANLLTVR